jgi:hypothetical protein
VCLHALSISAQAAISRPNGISVQIRNRHPVKCDIADLLPLKVSLRIEHNLSVKPTCLIASEIDNYLRAHRSVDLEPTMVQKILCFMLIEYQESATKCCVY